MIEVKNNAVLRDGRQIAVIDGGVCRSYSAFPPVVKGQIKKAAGNASLTFELVEDKGEAPETPVVQAIEEKPGLAPEAAKLLQLAKDAAQGKPPADPERRAIRDAITKANRKYPDWTEAIIAMLPDERARGWVDAKVTALGDSLSSSSAIYCEEFENVMLEAYDSIKKGETPLVQPVEEPLPIAKLASEQVQPTPEMAKAAEAALSEPRTIADLHALAEKGTIPKPPATHEALGSRTPAFVQWVKAHLSPEDFEAAYRGRKLPTIEEVEHEFGKLSRNLRQQEEASKDQNGGIRF